jgi:hypothetical protein
VLKRVLFPESRAFIEINVLIVVTLAIRASQLASIECSETSILEHFDAMFLVVAAEWLSSFRSCRFMERAENTLVSQN